VSRPHEPRVGHIRAFGVLFLALLVAASFAEDFPGRQWLRYELFDAYQRIAPRERASAPAVIVAIDENSLERYGQWPWPRRLIARLLAEIGDARPAAIGSICCFPSPIASRPLTMNCSPSRSRNGRPCWRSPVPAKRAV